MDTKLTIDEIELAIVNSGIFNKRGDIFVPNVSWGLLNHEADMVVMTKSGYLTEIEIKRSWEDFKADFKKPHEHKDERVNKLYYCVPRSIKERVVDYLTENEIPFTGLLYFSEEGTIYEHNLGGHTRQWYTGGRKLFLEEQLTIARLGCMRVWNLKQKLVDIMHNNESHKSRS